MIQNILHLLANNKTLIKYLIVILIFTISNIALDIINNNNELELLKINNKYNQIKELSNDEFVLKHLFKEDKNNTQNFIEYVKTHIQNNYGNITNIQKINSQILDNIKIETIEFNLKFPHDKFIFELLEVIQNYSNGFAIIQDIYIQKEENFNINRNNLSTKILCQLYTK